MHKNVFFSNLDISSEPSDTDNFEEEEEENNEQGLLNLDEIREVISY